MSTDFQYSTDFYGMNAHELSHTCMHLLCLAGEASFVFNEHCYHIIKNDLVVIPMPDRVCNLAAHADLQVEWFAADYKFLQNLLPSNNYSIGGSISLNQDPIIKLSDEQAQHLLDDFHRLRDQRDATDTHTDRTAYIVKQLMALLATGISRTERDVSYYAERLNVSPKYLSATIKRVTGHSVTSYIDRHTVPILKEYLNDERLSLTQIADAMNFTSLSYFSRYCTKHLGQSPSEYRLSLQPK